MHAYAVHQNKCGVANDCLAASIAELGIRRAKGPSGLGKTV